MKNRRTVIITERGRKNEWNLYYSDYLRNIVFDVFNGQIAKKIIDFIGKL